MNILKKKFLQKAPIKLYRSMGEIGPIAMTTLLLKHSSQSLTLGNKLSGNENVFSLLSYVFLVSFVTSIMNNKVYKQSMS